MVEVRKAEEEVAAFIDAAANAEVCLCGDWRSDHPNDGPCRHNKPGDLSHGFMDCTYFKPATLTPEARDGE